MEILTDVLRGFIGIAAMLAIAFFVSENKKRINWKLVISGIGIQIALALLILKAPYVSNIFDYIAKGFVKVLDFTKEGSEFLFAGIVNDVDSFGFIFAFQILPTIVFFAALSSALYYMGVIQKIVYAFAWLMSKTMRLSGAESLAAAGNIFLGQTESPLLVKPYLDKMSRSEIMCLMTGGMATIAGGVLGAYVGYLGGESTEQQELFASHLLAASIMSAPAAIVAAKMLVPEKEGDIDRQLNISKETIGTNILDAVSNGTRDGLKLAVNVGVMLLVFIAFMAMFNAIAFQVGDLLGINDSISASTNGRFDGLTFQYLLGMLFAPVAWLLGVEWADVLLVGQLLGEKTILNEFVAYASLGELKSADLFHDNKSIIIATYALCGFANFASIGIQIGGIGSIAPKQQTTLAKLGIKSLIGGTIACFLTATIAGMIADENKIIKVETDNSLTVERTYNKPNSDEPFMYEFGKVHIQNLGDTVIAEYCKDSIKTFHIPTQKWMVNTDSVCYNRKEIFINHKMIVNKDVFPQQSSFRKDSVVNAKVLQMGDNEYHLHQLLISIYKDKNQDTLIMRSNEYWTEELGLILKIDDNIAFNRKRMIETKETANPDISNIIADIYKDFIVEETLKGNTSWFKN